MNTIKVFFSYSPDDRQLRDELEQHLAFLKNQGRISTWHDGKILPGEDSSLVLESQLHAADIILILLSANFVSSASFESVLEQTRLLSRERQIKVIPIFAKPVDLSGSDLENIEGLPNNSRPITTWSNRDEAFQEVASGIRLAVDEMCQLKKEASEISNGNLNENLSFSKESENLRKRLRNASESTTEILNIFQSAIYDISLKIKRYLNADRVTVFFLNDQDQELWSLVAEAEDKNLLEITIPVGKGFAGEAASKKEIINIGYDVYDHRDSAETQRQDARNKYRTYTLLNLPVVDIENNLIAVIQFLNKLKSNAFNDSKQISLDHIDKDGFTSRDCLLFKEALPWISKAFQEFYDFYSLAYKMEMGQKRLEFIQAISRGKPQDVDDLLEKIMEATRKPVNADRCTLWLLDVEKRRLHTQIWVDNKLEEKELKLDEQETAIAVQVARSKEGKNISFDFYENKDAEVAKELDKSNKYRTCSLLCMPVLNSNGDVVGVTQLVNKTRQGTFQEYDHNRYPEAPERWKTSFSRADERRMKELNSQIAEVLESASTSELTEKDNLLLNNIIWITKTASKILLADRVVMFLLNKDDEQLLALLVRHEDGGSLSEVQIAIDESLAGEAAKNHSVVKIDRDFNLDPRSSISQKIGEAEYHIENLAAIPIIDPNNHEIIAVIEFLNKLDPFANPTDDLLNRIDKDGFDAQGIELFKAKYASRMLEVIKEFSESHQLVKQQRIIQIRHQAERSITKPGLTRKEQLRRVMKAAREMVFADRVTLWLVSQSQIKGHTIDDHGWKEIGELPINDKSIAGETALKKAFINVPCDLYQDPRRSETARAFDSNNKYRTCSLLCVPIFSSEDGELVGILQLINKVRSHFPKYVHEQYLDPEILPDCFRASFTPTDVRQIAEFSRTVGTVLHHMLLEKELKRYGEKLRD